MNDEAELKMNRPACDLYDLKCLQCGIHFICGL
jgi:hypothetical protein